MDNISPIEHHIKFMKDNNKEGKYDGVLRALRITPNPHRTDLFRAVM